MPKVLRLKTVITGFRVFDVEGQIILETTVPGEIIVEPLDGQPLDSVEEGFYAALRRERLNLPVPGRPGVGHFAVDMRSAAALGFTEASARRGLIAGATSGSSGHNSDNPCTAWILSMIFECEHLSFLRAR